ncbi:hypothetical protein [Amycolatopsis sp. NPDC004625]|uniref:hypothetical protein n=1 Tax=Amycolatopsis sp. NPDC004625 TaxID=3154670 RepID=UPI0033B546A2
MAGLDRSEIHLAQQLHQEGLSRPASILAIVMATRGYSRSENDLVEIVRQYPGLETVVDARKAIQELRDLNWLAPREVFGKTLTVQAPALRASIANRLGQPDVEDHLSRLRVDLAAYVKVVGSMPENAVFQSYLRLLESAQNEICLPMLVTAPYDDTVEVLRNRARAGVQVKILLAEPALAARIRSANVRSISAERIREWQRSFRDCPHAAVRLCRTAEDMELATCFSVDGRTVRFDVYDPYGQQSLEGVMLEVASPQGLTPNFVRLFVRLFDDAWSRSVSVSPLARAAQFLLRSWKLWFTIVALALAFLPVGIPHWSEILIGVSCGIGAPLIVEEGPKVGRMLRRRTG